MSDKNKHLIDLYKKHSKESNSIIQIKRKIKAHIYNLKLESDINFCLNAKKYIDSLKEDIIYNKNQLEIESAIKNIMKNEEYLFMSDLSHLRRCRENVINLNKQIREIELAYNYMSSERKYIIFRELKRRGCRIIKVLD